MEGREAYPSGQRRMSAPTWFWKKSDRCQAVQSPTPGTEVSKACVDCISVVLFCCWMAALILAISLSSHRICASKERLIGSSCQCSRGFLSRCLSWPHGSRRLSQWPNGSCSGDQRGSSACICIAVAYSWISFAYIRTPLISFTDQLFQCLDQRSQPGCLMGDLKSNGAHLDIQGMFTDLNPPISFHPIERPIDIWNP